MNEDAMSDEELKLHKDLIAHKKHMSLLRHDLRLKEFEFIRKKYEDSVARSRRKEERNVTLQDRSHEYSVRVQDHELMTHLMSFINYLNDIKDDYKEEMVKNAGDSQYTTKGRLLNAHEESLYNTALITLDRMIRNTHINRGHPPIPRVTE